MRGATSESISTRPLSAQRDSEDDNLEWFWARCSSLFWDTEMTAITTLLVPAPAISSSALFRATSATSSVDSLIPRVFNFLVVFFLLIAPRLRLYILREVEVRCKLWSHLHCATAVCLFIRCTYIVCTVDVCIVLIVPFSSINQSVKSNIRMCAYVYRRAKDKPSRCKCPNQQVWLSLKPQTSSSGQVDFKRVRNVGEQQTCDEKLRVY